MCHGTHNFALDPSPQMEQLRSLLPEPLCRRFHDARCRLVHNFVEMPGGPVTAPAWPSSPAFAASVTAATSEGETCRSVTWASGGRTWAAASRHPCQVPSTSQTTILTRTSSHQSEGDPQGQGRRQYDRWHRYGPQAEELRGGQFFSALAQGPPP